MGAKPLNIANLLVNISYCSHLLPLLVFILFYKRNKSLWVKVLLFYVVFSFAIDTVLLRLDTVNHRDTIYNILSIFTVIEYSIFTYVLYSIIENRVFRTLILGSAIAFYIFAVSLYIYGVDEDQYSFDSLPASVESILIVAYSIFYLFDQMNKPQVMFIYQEPNFWFVVGFIIYFSGTLFLFIQANNLDRDIRDNFWKINLFLNITKNILFAIAFSTKKSKSLHSSFDNPYDNDILENPYKT